jgi:putative drug exporter of the RND superfamily
MFRQLGRIVLRFRFVVVAAWVLLALGAVLIAPSLSDVGKSDEAGFLPKEAEAMVARTLVSENFPVDDARSRATLAFTRESGLTQADAEYIAGFATWATGADAPAEVRAAVKSVVTAAGHPELASMLRSPDGALEIMQVDLAIASFEPAANRAINLIRAHLAETRPDGLTANVTGAAGIGADYLNAIREGTDRTTIATIILVVVILLLIYRAPLAALAPLVTIGCAFLVSRGLLGYLAQAGWQISSLLDSFVVVIVFGVGTDYTIFLVSRFREELGHAEWPVAAQEAVGRIGAVISASAMTVIVGLGSMAIASFAMIQTTGPALALTVFVTLLAGLTLTPAFLGIFGHYLFWPLHERRGAGDVERGFWAALARVITRRPAAVSAIVLVALGLPLLALGTMRENFDQLRELPASSDARQGFDLVAQHFDRGQLFPLNIIIKAPGTDLSKPESLARIRATQDLLAALPGVARVRSIVAPFGDGVTADGFRPSMQLNALADSLAKPTTDAQAAMQALAKPDGLAGVDSAIGYVDALNAGYPGLTDDAAFTKTRTDLADYRAALAGIQDGLRVRTQLNGLVSALSAAASGGGMSDPAQFMALGSALQGYLRDLATAYPDMLSNSDFQGTVAALTALSRGMDPAVFMQLVGSLKGLAGTFEARPDAFLVTSSLPASSESRQVQANLAALKARLPGEIRAVSSSIVGRGDYFLPTTLSGAAATQVAQVRQAYLSEKNDVARLYVVLTDEAYSPAAFGTVTLVRDALKTEAAAYGTEARIAVGGTTAEYHDVKQILSSDFQRVAIITVIGVFFVLVLLLRALVAPIYLVLTVLLSCGSSLGIATFLFQDVLGHAGVNYFLPLLVFVLLVALGSDYNIFLMSRVREESDRRGVANGIRVASARTGTVITSAGIILAGTFAALTTAPLTIMFQVGMAVAIGVLVDTFIVRSLLVPALTAVLGDTAWWPFGRRGRGGGALGTGGTATGPGTATQPAPVPPAPTSSTPAA